MFYLDWQQNNISDGTFTVVRGSANYKGFLEFKGSWKWSFLGFGFVGLGCGFAFFGGLRFGLPVYNIRVFAYKGLGIRALPEGMEP